MIRLVEYETSRVTLSQAELAWLLPLVRDGLGDEDEDAHVLQAITPTSAPGVYAVRAGPYVGRLGLPGGRWIDFESRFPLDDVLRLILDADYPAVPRARDVSVPGSATPFFVDVIAGAFLHQVDRLVRAGLQKGYAVRRHLRSPYAGHIDTTFHLSRLGGRPDRLVTLSRRLTPDIALNSVLAAALDVLRAIPLDAVLSRRIASVLPAFAYVDATRARSALRTRLEVPRRYTAAFDLASLILQAQTLGPRGAGQTMPSILFFMPAVWEAYVARWVRLSQPHWRVEAGHGFSLTSSGVWARADAVAWSGSTQERLVALFDAKYKWARGAPKAADLYQMVTYATALGLSEATLVYPVAAAPRSVTVGDKTIHVVGLVPKVQPQSDRLPWRVIRLRPPD